MSAGCRCQVVGVNRDPYEPHIPAQPEWEQADDCPVHPLSMGDAMADLATEATAECNWSQCRQSPNPCFAWCKCRCHVRAAGLPRR